MTQSIATPEPGCPGHHLRSSRSSQRPWMCHHPWSRNGLVRMSCRTEYWQFSRALPVTKAHSTKDEDCHPRTTWRPLTLATNPCGQTSLPSHWKYWPHRLDATTAGREFVLLHQSVPSPATGVTAHTQVRDPDGSAAAACYGNVMETPSSWPSIAAVVSDADDSCSVITGYTPKSSFTKSPRRTTRPL